MAEFETLEQQSSDPVKTGCEASSYPQGLDLASNKKLFLQPVKNKKPKGKIWKEITQNLTK